MGGITLLHDSSGRTSGGHSGHGRVSRSNRVPLALQMNRSVVTMIEEAGLQGAENEPSSIGVSRNRICERTVNNAR